MLCDGQHNDPAVLVTAMPNFSVSETILLPQGQRLRIRAIERQISARLIEAGISAVVVVERLDAEGRSASLSTSRYSEH